MGKKSITIINRKAKHEYHIFDKYECGIVLKGTEVKSIRDGKTNIKDSFGRIEGSEVFLYNMHISPYEYGNRFNVDPVRKRKLLLNRYEIKRLIGKVSQKGLTLIPLALYFKNGYVKIELALAKGKKIYDKREAKKRRDIEREFKRYKIR